MVLKNELLYFVLNFIESCSDYFSLFKTCKSYQGLLSSAKAVEYNHCIFVIDKNILLMGAKKFSRCFTKVLYVRNVSFTIDVHHIEIFLSRFPNIESLYITNILLLKGVGKSAVHKKIKHLYFKEETELFVAKREIETMIDPKIPTDLSVFKKFSNLRTLHIFETGTYFDFTGKKLSLILPNLVDFVINNVNSTDHSIHFFKNLPKSVKYLDVLGDFPDCSFAKDFKFETLKFYSTSEKFLQTFKELDLEHLKGTIRELEIPRTPITGNCFEYFKGTLQKLNINHCRNILDSKFVHLRSCLRELRVNDCDITNKALELLQGGVLEKLYAIRAYRLTNEGLEFVGKGLKVLHVDGINSIDGSAFKCMKNLRELSCVRVRVKDDDFKYFSGLRKLVAKECKKLTSDCVQYFKDTIEELDLSYCKYITDDALVMLKDSNLTSLDIRHIHSSKEGSITKKGMLSLKGLNLKVLQFNGSLISGSVLKSFQHIHFHMLNISNWQKLKSLKFLYNMKIDVLKVCGNRQVKNMNKEVEKLKNTKCVYYFKDWGEKTHKIKNKNGMIFAEQRPNKYKWAKVDY